MNQTLINIYNCALITCVNETNIEGTLCDQCEEHEVESDLYAKYGDE